MQPKIKECRLIGNLVIVVITEGDVDYQIQDVYKTSGDVNSTEEVHFVPKNNDSKESKAVSSDEAAANNEGGAK